MPSAQEAREARRRKILARGSERLAFIAGELPSISSPSLPSPIAEISSGTSGSDIPSTSITRSGDAALIRLIDTSPSGKTEEYQEFASAEFDHKDRARLIKNRDEDSGSLQKVQDIPVFEEVGNRNLVCPQTSNDVNLSCPDEKLHEKGTGSAKGGRSAQSLITWDGIAYSIDVTQNYRALGAIFLALIALVQSFFDCADLEGKFFSNSALPWPVALVIVTDISLVFGALLFGLVRIPSLSKPLDVPEISTVQDQLSKVSEISGQLEGFLEVGTVIFKTTRALFLDCSIYAVTVISAYTLGNISGYRLA